jgi:hypothetical protein
MRGSFKSSNIKGWIKRTLGHNGFSSINPVVSGPANGPTF